MDSPQLLDGADIGEVIAALETHCQKCEKEGNYVEAELVKQKLDDLRKREESRRKIALKARQKSEKSSLEEANFAMYQHFNSMWDNEFAQFEEQARELNDSMKERHALELREFQQALANEPRHHPKFSRDLLNLRKIQETLAGLKNYTEAHKVKLKADAMEEWELRKLDAQERMRNENRLRQFQQQQNQELLALKKRLDREREEMRAQRSSDAERLLRRFRNVERELSLQQHFEKLRLERQKLSPGRVAEEGEGGVQALLTERNTLSPRTSLNVDGWAGARSPGSAGRPPAGSPKAGSARGSPGMGARQSPLASSASAGALRQAPASSSELDTEEESGFPQRKRALPRPSPPASSPMASSAGAVATPPAQVAS